MTLIPKLDVAGSTPVSRSKINNLQPPQKPALFCTTLRPSRSLSLRHTDDLPAKHRVFQFLCGDRFLTSAAPCVNIKRNTDAVAALIGGHLRIHFGAVAQTCIRPHYLKSTTQSDPF
jgi:hypothetical protein